MNNHQVLGNLDPYELLEKYGSPLYVYSENIVREKCNDIKELVDLPNFMVNYSAKANSNLELLRIINEEHTLLRSVCYLSHERRILNV